MLAQPGCAATKKISLQWEWDDLPPGEQRNHLNLMPGYVGGRFNAAGLKAIASFPRNPFKHGLPRASALITLQDVELGLPRVVMDGTLISAMRTGAVSGVGARYLAREDVTSVGLIGAGVQSRTQLMALQVASSIYRSAQSKGIGQKVTLWDDPVWM